MGGEVDGEDMRVIVEVGNDGDVARGEGASGCQLRMVGLGGSSREKEWMVKDEGEEEKGG